MYTQITYQVRHIFKKDLVAKLELGSISKRFRKHLGKIFNEGTEFERDGSQFDQLFQDGDHYKIGDMTCFAMHTPGHTPACMVHVMGDAAFAGDTLFMPDGGSARADFPGGDAGQLFDSITRVLSLPDAVRLFVCHDYGPGGRAIGWETTISAQKSANIHVGGETNRSEFVAMREARDAQLDMPKPDHTLLTGQYPRGRSAQGSRGADGAEDPNQQAIVLRPEIKVWRLDERQVKVTNGIHAFTIKPLEFVLASKTKERRNTTHQRPYEELDLGPAHSVTCLRPDGI